MHFLIRWIAHLIAPYIERAFGRLGDQLSSGPSTSRITLLNINAAAAPLLLGLLAAGFTVFTIHVPSKDPAFASNRPIFATASALVSLALFCWSGLTIWAVILGDQVIIVRPLRMKRYAYSQITRWVLTDPRRAAPNMPLTLTLVMTDGQTFTKLIWHNTANRVLSRLQPPATATGNAK